MNKPISLKEEAENIINILESVNVPSRGFEYFTVGDRFRPELFKLHEEVLKLNSTSINFLEAIIQGNIGAGKTHFLRYLQYLIERDAPYNTVISEINARQITTPDKFYLSILQGMRLSSNKKQNSYQYILQYSYNKIAENFQSTLLDRTEIKEWFSILLYYLIGTSTGASTNLIKLLGGGIVIGNIVEYFDNMGTISARRDIKNTLNNYHRNATPKEKEFIQGYMEIIDKTDPPLSSRAFENAARELFDSREVLNIILKILALAKIKTIVILIDELEGMKSLEPTILKQILENIADFRDSYPKETNSPYPSLALIPASTGEFFEDKIKLNIPALHSRWEGKVIRIQPFSAPDIDNLIFKLRDLYFLAGKNLSPINSLDEDEHQVIKIRKQLLADYPEPGDLTVRKIIRDILKKIDSTWVIGG